MRKEKVLEFIKVDGVWKTYDRKVVLGGMIGLSGILLSVVKVELLVRKGF